MDAQTFSSDLLDYVQLGISILQMDILLAILYRRNIYNQISLWVFISVVHSFNELLVHAFIYFFHFVVIIIYNYQEYFSRYLINMEYSIQQLHIFFSVSLKQTWGQVS